jgi:HK97 family phage major capsid protein
MSRRSLKMPLISAIDDLAFTNKNGTGAEVDATFSELELSTRYLRSMMVIHNELLEDSDYAVQQFLANQLTQKASVTLDNKAIYGTGASDELLGLSSQVNSSNKFNSAGTSLANFIADSVKAVRLVSQSIQLMNRATCGWVMSDTQYYGILGLATSTGAEPSLVAELKQGRLHGFPVFTSNTVTSTEIWFGDWSKVYLGIYKEASVTFELNGTFQIGSTTYVGRDIRKSPLRLEAELDIKLAYPKALSIIQASSLGA